MEPFKQASYVRVVIDADHHLSFACPHEISHALVVLERKIYTIPSRLPVRRVHVMEGVRPVVTLGALKPRQVLDVGARQTLPGRRKVLFDPQQVDGRTGRRGTERLPTDLASEGVMLQIEETGGALDIGEGFGACHLLPLKHLARAECPFELADEFFKVVLDDAIQRHQIAVDVVQDLNGGGLGAHEVEGRTSSEHFDVALVGWEQRDETVGQAAFAAHPRDDGCGHRKQDLYCIYEQVLGSLRFVHEARALAGLAGAICGNGDQARC